MSAFLRQYGVGSVAATAIYLNHPKYATPTDFAVAADWTPAAGDVKVSLDGGTAANIATLPTYVTNVGWKYVFSAGELTCQQLIVRIADSATKVIVDDEFIVETLGNSAAMWPDPSVSNPVIADVHLINGATGPAGNVQLDYDGTGYAKTNSTIGLLANALTAAVLASDAVAEIADGVWDEVLSGHQAIGTAGALAQVFRGTAQAGGGSSITLAAGAQATDSIYNDRLVAILAGTGAGQVRSVSGYVGSTKVATVSAAWDVTPDTTSVYVIVGN